MIKKTVAFVFCLLFLAIGASLIFAQVIPQPARVGGTVTVQGTLLTQAADEGYTFEITLSDGTSIIANGGNKAEDTDGLNVADWYLIDIPVYESDTQPQGAEPGTTVIIHIYKDGEELAVNSPVNGEITVGDSASVTQIDIEAINLPIINSFTASPPIILEGATSTLSWEVTNADIVSIDNGVGTVDAASGTIDVIPNLTTTYTLTAANAEGTVTSTVTVTIEVPWLEEALWIDTNPLDDTITIFARFDREITEFDSNKFELVLCDESDSVVAATVKHPAGTSYTNLEAEWLVITADHKPGSMESMRSDQICSLLINPEGLTHDEMVSHVPAQKPLAPMDLAQGHNYYDSLDLMDIQGKITRDGVPVTGTIKAYLVNIYEESSYYPVGDVTNGTFEISFRNVNNLCTTVKYDYSDPGISTVIDQRYGYVNMSNGKISSVYEGPLWSAFNFDSYNTGNIETRYPANGEPVRKWVEYRSGVIAGECEDEETCCGNVNAVLERDTEIFSETAISYAGYNYLFYDVCGYQIYQPQTIGEAKIMEDGTYFLHAYRAEWMRNWGADIVVLAVEEDNGEVSIISGLHENDSDYFIRYQPQLNNANGQAYSYIIGDADSFDIAAQAHGIPVNALTTFGLPVNKQFYTNETNPMAEEFQTKVGGEYPEEIQVENMAYFPVWDYNLDGPGIARDYIEDVVGLDYRGFSAVGSMGHMQYLGPGYGYAMMSRCHDDYDVKLFFHGKGVTEYKTPLVHNEDNNGWILVSVAGETGALWKPADAGTAIAKGGKKPDYVICFDDDFNAYSISFADADGVTFYGVQAGDLELWLNGTNLGDKKDYPFACFYHVPADVQIP